MALQEYRDAEFKDRRLTARLARIIAAVAKDPSRSFPEMLEDESQLEGLYRFLGNEKVSFESLLLPHRTATLARAVAAEDVLVVHDTSEFVFTGEKRSHIGRVNGEGGGFLGHFALAIAARDCREVLGILGGVIRYREEEHVQVRPNWRKRWRDPSKLSLRWLELADQVRQFVAGKARAIHIMDREGDSYELFSHLVKAGDRFVIRGHFDRSLEGGGTVPDALVDLPILAEREVRLSRRTRHMTVGNAPRESRMATLNVRATSVEIAKPLGLRKAPLLSTITLNVVVVREQSPPKGMAPVEWRIYTTEPISTKEEILRIVDYYRARWLVEEFFKSLKSGCSFQRRQLDSRRTVENALALMIPMAWTLLVLRQRSRLSPAEPSPLSAQQLAVLRAFSRKPLGDTSARTVMLAVARLGGHLKSNGDPGWQVVGRGFAKLLAYELGWEAARQEM